MSNPLGFHALTTALASVFDAQFDGRQQTKKQYELSDAALAAFAVFFSQSPSFLAHQRTMEKRKGKSNAQTLFGMEQIPTDTHIRTLLDGVPSESLFVVFRHVFGELLATGVLERFRTKSGQLLLALDGTGYFSSETIHCDNCSRRELKKGKLRYSHSVITPVVVSPEQREVISLEPSFILPQDGEEKQGQRSAEAVPSCEINAAKRWLQEGASHYELEGAIVLGDDLYSHQPYCQALLDKDLNFILVCKPDSHQTLYEYLTLHSPHELKQRIWNGRHGEIHHYRYAKGLPLRDGENALQVNWCELSITHEDSGKLLFRNSFATNLSVTADNVAEIVQWGRCRWKIENENNNVLKTKGYNMEHNYGHGKQNLSTVLVTLMLYAFLGHTVFALTLPSYQQVRKELGNGRAACP